MTEVPLKFNVVYFSSEDANNPISQLYSLYPNSKGWQSKKLCEYPQEIILQFEGDVKLKRAKLLSHETKIPRIIELYHGQLDQPANMVDAKDVDYRKCKFKRIGYLSLYSNKESNYRARQLKKLKLDVTCCFLKLVLHECHVNALNLYNQVSLIGVQFFGDVINRFPPKVLAPLQVRELPNVELENMRPDSSMSRSDDVDSVTAKQIKELMFLKQQAIEVEDFIEAQRLKEQIEHLKKVAVKIAQLERQKQEAVELEEFDVAARLKREIDNLRNSSAQGTASSMYSSRTGNSPRVEYKLSALQHSKSSSDVKGEAEEDEFSKKLEGRRSKQRKKKVTDYDEKPVSGAQNIETTKESQSKYDEPKEEDKAPPRVSKRQPLNYDDIPVKGAKNNMYYQPEDETAANQPPQQIPEINAKPPRRKRPAKIRRSVANSVDKPKSESKPVDPDDDPSTYKELKVVEDNTNTSVQQSDLPSWEVQLNRAIRSFNDRVRDKEPQSLSVKEMVDYSRIIDVFGTFAVQCLFCKKERELREAAIRTIAARLDSLPAKKSAILSATCLYLKHGLDDRITQVYYAAVDLLKAALTKCSNVNKNVAQSSVDPLIDIIIEKTGEANTKIKKISEELLQFIADQPMIGPALVCKHVTRLPKKTKGWKPILIRLQLLNTLIPKYKFSKQSGLTVNDCMNVVMNGYGNSNGEVRSLAIDVTVAMYKANPNINLIDKYNITEKTINPGIYKSIIKALKENGFLAEKPDEDIPVRESVKPKQSNKPSQKNAQKSKQPSPQPQTTKTVYQECEFCHLKGPFSDQEMDLHLVQECPWLCECALCGNVIEIPEVQKHLLSTDCIGRDLVEQCPICMQVIMKADAERHKVDGCKPLPPNTERCPLCLEDIPPGKNGWTEHLLKDGCPRTIVDE